MSPTEILAWTALAFWLALALDRPRRWPGELRLPAAEVGGPGSGERLVAVVPARDEAELLPETLPPLLGQRPDGLEVVLVDDGSRDRTAEVARRVASEAGRTACLTVIEAGPAPAGWTGKPWALHRGVARACHRRPPEWLLLVDADVRLRSGALAGLLAKARDPARDLVSVMARLRCKSFWERLLIPPFVYFFQLLYPFRLVSSRRSRRAAAAGGCVLVRRRTLEAAGGIRAIRGAVIDDLALARAVAAAGGQLWLGLDSGIESLRRYDGLRPIWNMVARSAFAQLGNRYAALPAVVAGLVLGVASPPALALAALAGLAASGGSAAGDARALAAALAAWGLQALSLSPVVRHLGAATGWSLTLPAAALLYAGMCVTSAWRHAAGRGVRWKGRTYAG